MTTAAAAAVKGAKEPLEQVKTYDGQKSPRLVLILLLPGHGQSGPKYYPSRGPTEDQQNAIPAFLGKRRHHYQTLSASLQLLFVVRAPGSFTKWPAQNPIFSWHLEELAKIMAMARRQRNFYMALKETERGCVNWPDHFFDRSAGQF